MSAEMSALFLLIGGGNGGGGQSGGAGGEIVFKLKTKLFRDGTHRHQVCCWIY